MYNSNYSFLNLKNKHFLTMGIEFDNIFTRSTDYFFPDYISVFT